MIEEIIKVKKMPDKYFISKNYYKSGNKMFVSDQHYKNVVKVITDKQRVYGEDIDGTIVSYSKEEYFAWVYDDGEQSTWCSNKCPDALFIPKEKFGTKYMKPIEVNPAVFMDGNGEYSIAIDIDGTIKIDEELIYDDFIVYLLSEAI